MLERAFRKRKIAFKIGVRFSGVEQTDNGVTVSLENGKTIEAELLLVAVGRGPVDRRASATRRPASRWTAASSSPTSAAAPTSPSVYAVGDIVPEPAARARRLRRGHLRRRGDRRPRTRRRSTTPASRGSPTASPRSPRSASPRPRPRRSTATTGRDARPTTSAGNGKSQILKTAGFVKLVRAEGRPGRRRPHGRQPGRRADRRGPADLQLGGVPRRRRPARSTRTRPRTRRSARRTSRSPASRCTCTADRPTRDPASPATRR